jgi:hypothetical protein
MSKLELSSTAAEAEQRAEKRRLLRALRAARRLAKTQRDAAIAVLVEACKNGEHVRPLQEAVRTRVEEFQRVREACAEQLRRMHAK